MPAKAQSRRTSGSIAQGDCTRTHTHTPLERLGPPRHAMAARGGKGLVARAWSSLRHALLKEKVVGGDANGNTYVQ